MSSNIENFNLHVEKAEGKDTFIATVKDDRKNPIAENTFKYHIDTFILSQLEDSVGTNIPENAQRIKTFGSGLFNAVFAGEVLGWYQSAQEKNRLLRLKLFFKKDEPELLRIPWEFLYDGKNFLSAYAGISLLRVIDGIPSRKPEKIRGKIRILAIVSSPLDLKNNERLQIEREQMLILQAVDRAVSANKIDIEFEDEASLKNILARLDEEEFHILHYTGHGMYSEKEDKGYLLLEDEKGNSRPVDNETVADLLAGYPSLRLVVLSGCQTAKTSGIKSLRDLSTPLLIKGIPAVVSMQYSVADISAMALAEKIYTEIGRETSIDRALTEARKELYLTKERGTVDFATPVLYSDEPDCLCVEEAPLEDADRERKITVKPHVLLGIEQLGGAFIGRRKILRRIKEDFLSRNIRAVVLHGFGGIGKTVTAAKTAEKLEKQFDGIYSITCKKDLKFEEVLMQLNEFLKILGIKECDETITAHVPVEMKINALGQVLTQVSLIVIFDNVESLLNGGKDRREFTNPDLKKGIKLLVNQCKKGTRFIFTSRYTFNLTDGRITAEIDEINLGEFPQPEAIMVMNRFPEIAKENFSTKINIYEKTGGHPYTINMFGRHARSKPAVEVLKDIAHVNKKMVEFTLLDKSYEALSKSAKDLIDGAAVFRKTVPLDALKWMIKKNGKLPDIDEELEELIHWGLIVKIEAEPEEVYHVHTLVKEFIKEKTREKDWKKRLIKGAEYYEDLVKRTKSVWDHLDARELYFEAAEYNKAGVIVSGVMEYLYRWGFIELVRGLNEETIKTTEGLVKASALHHIGMIYHDQGEYNQALEKYTESLKIKEEIGNKSGIAVTLHQLGNIYYQQGEYEKALEKYTESLKIKKELGDKQGIAKSLHQLGNIYYQQGEYEKALEKYTKSLKIAEELGDKLGIAKSLHQLGMIYHDQGEYNQALKKYNESLKITEELGDKRGIAQSLHQLGMIYHDHGDYESATSKYTESLKISEELGDKLSIASTLHQLGNIYCWQGEYKQALEKYNESLKIKEELSDKRGIAQSLHQLGMIYHDKGEYDQALEKYTESLKIAEELGDKRGIAQSLHQLGMIYHDKGEYDQALEKYTESLKIKEEIDDKRGIASTLGQLGNIYYDQDNNDKALDKYIESLKISEALRDKSGIAICLWQIGKVYEIKMDFKEALRNYIISFSVFESLHSPEKNMVGKRMSRLQEKLGKSKFKKYYNEIYEKLESKYINRLAKEDIEINKITK